MIVADTSPLNYLILIDAVEILPALFGETLISPAVHRELSAEGASDAVRNWIDNFPVWLKVAAVGEIDETIRSGTGETEAISLAIERRADYVLLDDKAARLAARARNLKVVGTLGVLKYAAENKLLDFETAVRKLQNTNFRTSKKLLEELINLDRQNKFSN